MALLAEYSCRATPGRRVVEVYDADALLGDGDALETTASSNQLALGLAGEMTLPRPAVYEGPAWWVNRQAVADYYDTTLARLAEDASDGWLTEAWDSTRSPEPIEDEDIRRHPCHTPCGTCARPRLGPARSWIVLR